MNNYKIQNNNIHIQDSYLIHKKSEMNELLLTIKQEYPNLLVFEKRSINSLIREWRAHNLLYKLGLFKNRTKDVDLDIYETALRRICYFILSIFYC